MSETTRPSQEEQERLSDGQLHERACVVCGTEQGPFVPAGHRYTPTSGAALGWAVVACAAHAPEAGR
ncbi:hypothetical protein ACFV4M_01950 [Kitasatospora indigofera]|uniref:hypothetical protein n=1 Tax=Kitasatospora indigofera TaxID=67307 RepID=UPI003658F086